MTAPQEVLDLVEHFERQRDTLMSGAYNEAQLRKEFLDPFFAALGWDMANKQGHAEAYKEVIHEDSIRIAGEDGGPRAPDYCFRVGGTRKFFVEAKKPAVNVKEQIEPAYQLRRYAWSAKLPLSILTDFEELAVYDCRVKPAKTDKATVARVMYFTYRDYAEKWDEIAGIFSKDAILKGSFDKYAEDTKRKRGTAEVDSAFLKEIEGWREALAHNIALRNKALSQRDLNHAVQSTIDRIVFLRICEDRDIERYGRLMGETNGPGIYGRLFELFKEADAKYNSGLFHFQAEKDQAEEPDRIAAGLVLDDKVLRDIIKGLYYPDCPYEFSVLGADILGQVYEQFLGKVIRLTEGHRAVIEEKPEVRKAGGVYYTPTYIVDYIVEHTVGKILEGKTPRAAAKLRILDPACGSGSFLIGAYQYLLDWHLKWYLVDGADKHNGKELYQRREDDWRLTTSERKRILVNNIYGVDIDPQAAEVTKLSLLLKVLEGETEQSLNTQMRLYHERALPDLGRNIKCGNSLIGTDFYEGQQMTLLDEEELYRVNAFDWDVEFAEIMRAGGFGAVIGNPPYVFGRDWKALGIGADIKVYLGRYASSAYQLDMFSLFMDRALGLLHLGGRMGFIVPNTWLTNVHSRATRCMVLAAAQDLRIMVPKEPPFGGLTVDTVVFTLAKSSSGSEEFVVERWPQAGVPEVTLLKTRDYADGTVPISTRIDRPLAMLFDRLRARHPTLHELARVTRGVHPYRLGGYGRSAFVAGPQTERDIAERPYHSPGSRPGYRPFVYGRDLRWLSPVVPTDWVKYGPWLAEPRDPWFFEGERVLSRKILGDRLVVTACDEDYVVDQQVYVSKPRDSAVGPAYLAGVLGSSLVARLLRTYYDEDEDAFPQVKVKQLKDLPIPDPRLPEHAADSEEVARWVREVIELNVRLDSAAPGAEPRALHARLATARTCIDQAVIRLYELGEDDVTTLGLVS